MSYRKKILMGMAVVTLMVLNGCTQNSPKPTKSKALVLELENQKSEPTVHVGKIDFYVK